MTEISTNGTPRSRKDVLLTPIKYLNSAMRKLAGWTHRLEMRLQWEIPPQPEWFDHFCDQFWDFSARQNTFWLERGVFSRLFLRQGGKMLELCCGDGFNSKHFYSNQAKTILAVDFDHGALWHAKTFNSAPNITYQFHDIRTDLPSGPFDNIVWDAAIEHFTEVEIDALLRGIKDRLGETGILSGYTLVEKPTGELQLHWHEREFKGIDDLRSFFTPHFKHVYVWETIHPLRHNLYFACSQSPIGFFASNCT